MSFSEDKCGKSPGRCPTAVRAPIERPLARFHEDGHVGEAASEREPCRAKGKRDPAGEEAEQSMNISLTR